MTEVTCFECKVKLNKDIAIKYNSHYYHNKCYSQVLARKNFSDYVCNLFHISKPGSAIWSQRKRLLSLGYDDIGIVNTLRYMYQIKKMSVSGAEQRIGLVPTYYSEAEDYWELQKKKENQMLHSLVESLEKEKERKVIVVERPINKRHIELLSFINPEVGDN